MNDFGWTRMAVINQNESPLDSVSQLATYSYQHLCEINVPCALQVADELKEIFDSKNWDLHEAGFIKQASQMKEIDYSEFLTMVHVVYI